MAFIKDLCHDEIRDGYLVTADTKKVWERQLEIWQEVDRICRKHSIPYWAGYGTLLGAARHKGFIPWDTDFDLCMMRPDFNRFCKIAEDELRESNGLFEVGLKNFSVFRISHSQTTLLSKKDFKDGKILREKKIPRGLMIEVFALDVALDGTENSFFATNALNELMGTIYNFSAIEEHVQKGGKTVNDWSVIEELNSLPDVSRQHAFINVYATALFNQSSNVAWIEDTCRDMKKYSHPKSFYRETIYLPFESIQLPAPVDYEKFLTRYFGDWRTFVNDGIKRLGLIHSADIPYEEFVRLMNSELFFPKK